MTCDVLPVVAVTASSGSVLDDDQGLLSSHWVGGALVRAISTAGAVPVIVPVGISPEEAAVVVGHADALVLSGGDDVSVNGAPYRSGHADEDRDGSEQALLDHARRLGLPILGICRGLHLMAAWSGGRLAELDGHASGPQGDRRHEIRLAPQTRLAAALGVCTMTVNTKHHFAVTDPGPYRVAARAPDGSVEAIEHPDRWETGVQWHPEFDADPTTQRLWDALVDAARSSRQVRGR